MTENTNPTSTEGPVTNPTPEVEPIASEPDASTTPAQPSVEELQAQIERLRASNKGTKQEWEREKQRREELERRLQTPPMYPQQPQGPPAVEPEWEQQADEYYQAVLDGDKKKLARIMKANAERPVYQIGQVLNQASIMNQQQQAAANYLSERGAKPGSAFYKEVMSRVDEAKSDPQYAFCAGNPNALAAIIANEVKAEGRKTVATEKLRQESVDAAAVAGAPAGKAPGKAEPVNKMYFTEEETRIIQKRARSDGMDIVTAQKRYWENMDPRIKQARQDAGRA